MIYVETAAAAEIFGVCDRALRISVQRNSTKYPFIRIESAGARSRGGVKLLFAVEATCVDAAINSGKIDKDIDVYLPDSAQGCGYRAVKFSEFSRADEIDSENSVKAQNLVRPLKFVKGEDDDKGLCNRANHGGNQAQDGKPDGVYQGVCDAFRGGKKEQKANANMLGNNRVVARDRKGNKGVVDANNAMDARGSIDTCGGDGGVFGASLANTDDRRDQAKAQINAVYTVSNLEELKSGSIGLDHSGNLVTGWKNKNLDAVVNRDLRHHSSSNDNKAALTRKTLDKSEVLGYAKLYGVKAAAQAYGAKEKSIYRWQKEFAQKGGEALEDKRGGTSKANVKMIKDAILSIGTAQKTSWWMEYCRRYALSKGLNFDMFAPLSADISRSTFLRHASKIASEDYEVRAYLRGGLDVVATNIAISRGYLKTNEEWQVDATNFDFMCLDENGEQKRYTAVGFVDTASGRMVYDLCDSPNGYANVRLLKRALKKMGRPGYVKGDNGKDYVGEHFQGVLKRLGIVYVRSPKYEGRAKGKIERAHGVMQNFFEGLPGFLGHDAGQRIQREDQALEKSKRLSGVKTNISNLLTREQMQATIEEYCERMFDWSAEFEPFIFDERTFGASVIRMLQAEGFSVCGVKYVSLEVFSHIKIGEKCELIEDIDDASKFYVYKDGRYLCEVVNEEIASYTAEEVRTARKEYVRKFINPTKAYIKSLTDEMDGYQKAMAQARLAERQKGKAEVIKKDEAKVVSKIEQEASVGNNVIYLPDPADAIKSLEG